MMNGFTTHAPKHTQHAGSRQHTVVVVVAVLVTVVLGSFVVVVLTTALTTSPEHVGMFISIGNTHTTIGGGQTTQCQQAVWGRRYTTVSTWK